MILAISMISLMLISDGVYLFSFVLLIILSAVTTDIVKPGDEPGRRGEFVDFTYKRFDGLTQKSRYDPKKISRGSESSSQTAV